jgi:hypothetical protein
MRPPERRRGPRQGPAPKVHREDDRDASCSPIWPLPQDHGWLRQDLRFRRLQDLRFRRLSERVWSLGPRPCAEAMLAIAACQDPLAVLEDLARDWPPSVWRAA